jgi:Tol biopolymer transport system component
MRNRMMIMVIVGIILLVVGCRVEYSEKITVETPCWTENGKITYIKEYKKWKITYNTFGENAELIKNELILMECNNDGTGKEEKGLIFDDWWYPLSMNSSGTWIVMSVVSGDSSRIYVMKLDGSGLQLLGEGLYPDLSPDGSKIVYAKKNEGIWIMNRDGSGDHQIVTDTTASYPAWSPDDTLIAYVSNELKIIYTNGILIKSLGTWKITPSWSKSDKSRLMYSTSHPYWIHIANLFSNIVDTLNITGSHYARWSPDGEKLINYDTTWYVINIDGTDKHYIEP